VFGTSRSGNSGALLNQVLVNTSTHNSTRCPTYTSSSGFKDVEIMTGLGVSLSSLLVWAKIKDVFIKINNVIHNNNIRGVFMSFYAFGIPVLTG
jgi:hypothetical protein